MVGGGSVHLMSLCAAETPLPFTAGITVTSCPGWLGSTGLPGPLVGPDGLG